MLMIASGSVHAIVKGGRDKMAGRALTDGTNAAMLLPATVFVPWPSGAWGWLTASALLHGLYLAALVRAYQVGDLSAVYPLLRGTAPLVTEPATSVLVLGARATAGRVAGGLGILADAALILTG